MTTQTEITYRNHRRAVRFFWGFLIGATLVSLIGNIVHAIWHLIPFCRDSDRHRRGPAAFPPSSSPRDRSQRSCWRVGHGLSLRGHRDRRYRRGGFRDEFPRSTRSLDPGRHTTCMGMVVPCSHRYSDRRQHHDARCARRQTRPACTSCQYTNCDSAEGGANPCAERKDQGQTVCSDQCAGTNSTRHGGANGCTGRTRSGTDSAGLSANRR